MSEYLKHYPNRQVLEGIRNIFGLRKIFWDIDGTCKNSLIPVVNQVNKDYGLALRPSQIIGFNNISEHIFNLRPDLNMPLESLIKIEWDYWTNPDILSQAPDVAGARFIMFMLGLAGYEQQIVTSRNPDLLKCTRGIPAEFAPWIQNSNMRSDLSINGSQFKAEIVGNNVLFDDSVKDAEAVVEANPDALVILTPGKADIGKLKHPRVIEVSEANGERNLWYAWMKLKHMAINVAQY